ncbi:MAG: N-acyl homoserine lactonase family protein [Myxococcota bacterium]
MKHVLSIVNIPLFWACATVGTPALPNPAHVGVASHRISADMRLTALRVGFVQVRPTHYEGDGPGAIRLSRIVMESSWSRWMPVIVYLIEHPDGAVLVDTGLSQDIALDPSNLQPSEKLGWFYRSNLRLFLPPEDELSVQLKNLGISPDAVTHVVLTHLHADHTGNIDLFPKAQLWTGEGNWPSHTGSVWKSNKTPKLIGEGELGTSQPLTADGRIRIVRLPGHTPGHVGVAIYDPAPVALLVGDATFDLPQTKRGGVSGISEDMEDARRTQNLLRELPPQTLILPSHDDDVFGRIEPRS